MSKMNVVRGFAKAGAVLMKIAEVFLVIGLVFAVLGIIALTVLPADLFRGTVSVGLDMKINMVSLLGQKTWDEGKNDVAKELAKSEMDEEKIEEISVEGDGLRVRAGSKIADFDRATASLLIAPSILIMAIAWYFCFSLRKLLVNIRDGGEPFTKENAGHLRTCGITLFISAATPLVLYGLIGAFTKIAVTGSNGIDLNAVFAGLMLLGLAALFEVAAEKVPPKPEAAPFGGYTGFTGSTDAPRNDPQTPASGSGSGEDDPNAF